jgi:hypothetical protein
VGYALYVGRPADNSTCWDLINLLVNWLSERLDVVMKPKCFLYFLKMRLCLTLLATFFLSGSTPPYLAFHGVWLFAYNLKGQLSPCLWCCMLKENDLPYGSCLVCHFFILRCLCLVLLSFKSQLFVRSLHRKFVGRLKDELWQGLLQFEKRLPKRCCKQPTFCETADLSKGLHNRFYFSVPYFAWSFQEVTWCGACQPQTRR